MKILIYLMVLTSFLGARFFSIDLKFFQLSVYRIIILLIAFYILNKCQAKPRPNSFELLPQGKTRNIVLFYIFWFLYAVITIIWVEDFDSWLRAVYFIASGLLGVIFITIFIREKKDFVKVFIMMQIMVIMHNVIGWYEIITGDYKFLNSANAAINFNNQMPVSMMHNTNDFALLMTFGVFISFICLKNTRSVVWKASSIALIISCIALIIRTDSRANIIGLLIGLALLVLLYSRKDNFKNIVLKILVLALVFAALPSIYEKLVSLLSDKLQFNDFGYLLSSDAIRTNLIKNGFVFLGQTFGLGTGAGNIEYWMTNWRIYDTGDITNIHNWWMELLTGYGVYVFAGYIWVYARLAKGFITAYMQNEDEFITSVSLGLLCCMATFLIGAVSSSSNINKEWLWLFWGVAVGMYYYIDKQGRNEVNPTNKHDELGFRGEKSKFFKY